MATESICVSVRARPLNDRERRAVIENGKGWIIDPYNNFIRQDAQNKKNMHFDRVFAEDADNLKVYTESAKHIVDSSLDGVNGTVFAYGQTSSGKTFSMMGIMKYGFSDIFSTIKNDTDRKYQVVASYVEIYNEKIADLLDPTKTNLKVIDTPTGPRIVGLSEREVRSEREIFRLLEIGQSSRHVGSTLMNDQSSRSHTIFTLNISSTPILPGEGVIVPKASTTSTSPASTPTSTSSIPLPRLVRGELSASLNFVDLAGSERASSTGAQGQRLKEGAHINKSLLTLGAVIRRICEIKPGEKGHIPFRDSKLTRILQPALGGNSRTSVICCVTQSSSHVEETIGTLGFAWRCKMIRNKVGINEVVDEKTFVVKLQQELEFLRGQLRLRERELQSAGVLSKDHKDQQTGISQSQSEYEKDDEENNSNQDEDDNREGDGSRKRRRQGDGSSKYLSATSSPESPPSSTYFELKQQRLLNEALLKKLRENGVSDDTLSSFTTSVADCNTATLSAGIHVTPQELNEALRSIPHDSQIRFANPLRASALEMLSLLPIASMDSITAARLGVIAGTNGNAGSGTGLRSAQNGGLISSGSFLHGGGIEGEVEIQAVDIENDSAFFDHMPVTESIEVEEDETVTGEETETETNRITSKRLSKKTSKQISKKRPQKMLKNKHKKRMSDVDVIFEMEEESGDDDGDNTNDTNDVDVDEVEEDSNDSSFESDRDTETDNDTVNETLDVTVDSDADADAFEEDSLAAFSSLAITMRSATGSGSGSGPSSDSGSGSSSSSSSHNKTLLESQMGQLQIRVRSVARMQLQSDVLVAARLVLRLSESLRSLEASRTSTVAALREEKEALESQLSSAQSLLTQVQENLSRFARGLCAERDALSAQVSRLRSDVLRGEEIHTELLSRYKSLEAETSRAGVAAEERLNMVSTQLARTREDLTRERTQRSMAEQRASAHEEAAAALQIRISSSEGEVESLRSLRDAAERSRAVAAEECVRLGALVREYENELDEIRSVITGGTGIESTLEKGEASTKSPLASRNTGRELAERAARLAVLEETSASVRALLVPYSGMLKRKSRVDPTSLVSSPSTWTGVEALGEEDLANVTIDFSSHTAFLGASASKDSNDNVSGMEKTTNAVDNESELETEAFEALPMEEVARRVSHSLEVLRAKYGQAKATRIQTETALAVANAAVADATAQAEEAAERARAAHSDAETLRSVRTSLERETQSLTSQNQALRRELARQADAVAEAKGVGNTLESALVAERSERVALEQQLDTLRRNVEIKDEQRRADRRQILAKLRERESEYSEKITELATRAEAAEKQGAEATARLAHEKRMFEALREEATDLGEAAKEKALEAAEKAHEEGLRRTRDLFKASLEEAQKARIAAVDERHAVEEEFEELRNAYETERGLWAQAREDLVFRVETLERRVEAETEGKVAAEQQLSLLRRESAAAAVSREEGARAAEKENVFLREELESTRRQRAMEKEEFIARLGDVNIRSQADLRSRAILEGQIESLKAQLLSASRQVDTATYERTQLQKKLERERAAFEKQTTVLRGTLEELKETAQQTLISSLESRDKMWARRMQSATNDATRGVGRKDGMHAAKEQILERRLEELEAEAASAAQKLHKEIAQLRANHDSELRAYKNEAERSHVSALRQERERVEDYKNRVAELESELKHAREELTTLRSSAANSSKPDETKMAAIVLERDTLKDKNIKLKRQLLKYDSTFTEMENRYSQKQSEYLSVLQKYESAQDRVNTLQTDLEQRDNEVASLRSKTISGDSQAALLRAQIASSSSSNRGGKKPTDHPIRRESMSDYDPLNNSFSEDFSTFMNRPISRPLQSSLKPSVPTNQTSSSSAAHSSGYQTGVSSYASSAVPLQSALKTSSLNNLTTNASSSAVSGSASSSTTTTVSSSKPSKSRLTSHTTTSKPIISHKSSIDELDNTINLENLLNLDGLLPPSKSSR